MLKSISNDFCTIKEASVWASAYLNKRVINSNILLIVEKWQILRKIFSKDELKAYYDTLYTQESLKSDTRDYG